MEALGRRLFSASADRTIRVWDTDSKRCIQASASPPVSRCPNPGSAPSVFIFAAAHSPRVCLLTTPDLSHAHPKIPCSPPRPPRQVLEDHTRPVLSLAWSDSYLFSGSYDNTIRVWDLTTLRKVSVLQGHVDAVRALAVSGNRLFSGSYDNSIRVWDTETFASLGHLQGHTGPVRAPTVHPASAARRAARSAKLTHPPCRRRRFPQVRTLVTAAGRLFSGSYDRTVRAWDVATLACLGVLDGHRDAVRALATANRLIFSGSDDTTARRPATAAAPRPAAAAAALPSAAR